MNERTADFIAAWHANADRLRTLTTPRKNMIPAAWA